MAQPTPGVGAPPPPKKRRRGGCLGCLIPLLLIVLVVVGGLYFLVASASAAVSVPAQLIVVAPATTLTHAGNKAAAVSGALVHLADSVATDTNGRSLIQFQDGSIIRLAPATSVTLNAAEFDKTGSLNKVDVTQAAGRTLSTVEKLVGAGSGFTVQGHSANASVRGTKFEVIANPDGSVRVKVFNGKVAFGDKGHNTVLVSAGQQSDAAANGNVSNPVAITPNPNDPFNLWLASEEAAKGAGQPATAQTTFSAGALGTGGTANQPDYLTAGGEVIGELAFPGSAMTLTITDPTGRVYKSSRSTSGPNGKLVMVDIPSAPGGAFKVSVHGDDVNPAENFTVTMVTKFTCGATQVTQGGYVRNVLSANELQNAINQSGAGNASIHFGGASNGGATISATGNFSGTSIEAGVIVYAAGGGSVGIAVTTATVNGISLKQQISTALGSASGHNFDSMQIGFSVDRLYSCSANKDTFLVIEGHS